MTVYVPDDLAAEVKDKLAEANVSAICQGALRAELDRAEAVAKIDQEGYERVEVFDGEDERDVAFRGNQIGYADYKDQTAYLTPKGAIAVYVADDGDGRLYIYDNYEEFAAVDHPGDLAASVAASLGEKYVHELDI
jgi:hypothetical protein